MERVQVSRLEGAFELLIMRKGQEDRSGVGVPLVRLDYVVVAKVTSLPTMWSWRY